MSQLLIHDYLGQLDLIKKVSGSQCETIVREAFKDLLKAWGRQHDLVFLAEYPLKTATKANISVDGALLHELRMPLGYWEAKDAADDLDEEIATRFKKGYQLGNRCAIDWVLDQHKEKKPKDPTIREKFDTYRLKDQKEKVVDLLQRVTTVSVQTVRITEEMKGVAR
jgi:hypothetical protein